MKCNVCGADAGQDNYCPNCRTGLQNSNSQSGRVENFGLVSAYKSMFKKYAQFEGRSRRSEYWLASVANAIVILVLGIIFFGQMMEMMLSSEEAEAEMSLFGNLGMLAFIAYSIIIIVPSLAITVRRLHDTGKSGWFVLLSFIPGGGIILFVLTLLDSQPGVNKYGPNPKGQ